MTDEKEDELDATERFLRDKARIDAEQSARLAAAREEAIKMGKEPFSAEVLSQYFTPSHRQYFTPSHRLGHEHSKILKALEEFEWTYYVREPENMTLEEFRKEADRDLFSGYVKGTRLRVQTRLRTSSRRHSASARAFRSNLASSR